MIPFCDMRLIPFLLVAAAAFVNPSQLMARGKTDLVVLNNGDRIHCEIKQLDRGKLRIKTDGFGTVEVKWGRVDSLQSQFYYRVVTGSGSRHYGTPVLEGETMRVLQPQSLATMEKKDVVEILALERSFWSKLDGSLAVGYSFTKASQIQQFNTEWDNVYRDERNRWTTKVSTTLTDNRESDKTSQRAVFGTDYYRLLRRTKWAAGANTSLERNDELNIASRILFGVSVVYTPIRTNSSDLAINVGTNGNLERAAGSADATQSVEGVISIKYRFFLYDSPKTDLSTQFDLYPSFTENNRFRTQFDGRLRRELISDFFFDITYYNSFDSKAPGEEGKKTDYGITTGISWSYNR